MRRRDETERSEEREGGVSRQIGGRDGDINLFLPFVLCGNG